LSQSFFLVLLLTQWWPPPLRLQVLQCSTFRNMCDFPGIAIFCSESIKCFPGTAFRFFLKLFVTIPVPLIITGIIAHFRFHICFISVPKRLYFNLNSASFCTPFLPARCATSISVHVFSFFVFNYNILLYAVNSLSVCTAWFHNAVTSSYSGFGMCLCVCVCECTIFLSFRSLGLCVLNNANVHKIYCVSLSIHCSPKWGILKLCGR
jgi:hypothetical protein